MTMINVLKKDRKVDKIKGKISKYTFESIKIIPVKSIALNVKYLNLGTQWRGLTW